MTGDFFEVFRRRMGIVSYMVKRLEDLYPDKQIGASVLTKMIYLYSKDKFFHYSMYHTGPEAGEVWTTVEYAKQENILDVQWKTNYGYFIHVLKNKYEKYVPREEKILIDEAVKKYGKYPAIELSMIAVAAYSMDQEWGSDKDEVVRVVKSLRPNYKGDVKKLLEESLYK